MKVKHIIKFAVVALIFSFSFTAVAQTLRTGYFLKGNPYSHRLNPALMNDRHYISFPMLGSINLNTAGKFGISKFIYDAPNGNGLVTFMHPSIDTEGFMSNIDSNNRLALELDMDVFSMGFFAFGGYNTLDFALHSRSAMNVPYDMFKFLKTLGGGEYDLAKFNVTTRNYFDISLGHSHKLNDDFTLGVRLKALLGVAYADLMLDKMKVQLSGERWMIDAKGSLSAALGGRFTFDESGMVNNYENPALGIHGIGFGADLGFTYDLTNLGTKGLVISASVTDLGFMMWKNVSTAGFSPEPYVFEGFDEIATGADGATIEEQLDAVGEDLGNMFMLADNGVADKNEMLSATLHIALEYRMPFYEKLSAALLFSNRFNELYPYNQISLILNCSPVNWLNFAISGTNTNLGLGFVAMLNLHCPGFSFFIGSDYFITKVNKQYIPLNDFNSSVSFGINIPFGKRRD